MQQRIQHFNSYFPTQGCSSMAMKSFDNNHLDKWKFMRILVDLQWPEHNGMLDDNYSCIRSAYWKRSSDSLILFHSLLWILPYQKSFFMTYSKWMDLRAPHDGFRFQHCIVMTKINRTQQVWIGNQFINTEARKFTFFDLIMIIFSYFCCC